ncbi:class I SAM-dependent methyltransferase [Deinococcus aquatilis]|uniref:class I SAM-dependent methyltransferase n=1 Tax=Deinococcus aquatilis TaxID=519440 RepID=UPI000380F93A|nr:class I SAM-dependent methyltransferase [Deinococcus aquatilis]
MTDNQSAGRAWSDDLARRPNGYTQTWNQWIEGPDAQAQFDALVLEKAAGQRVLDCGCGDGQFTVHVAHTARQITGLDYSAGLLAHARHNAAQAGLSNVAFVLGHARQETPLQPETFDLAYSRRGPNIGLVVPEFVCRGGLLLGLHPLSDASQTVRYAESLQQSALEILHFEGIDDTLRFPTLPDLAGFLNRTPGMPDVRQPEHQALLRQHAAALTHPEGGYAKRVHYLLWMARRV